jgi:hypothetical protein
VSLLNLHPGLRLSAIGGVVFLAGILTLLFLPPAASVFIMIAGGMGVWSGFLWTLFSWYVPPSEGNGET